MERWQIKMKLPVNNMMGNIMQNAMNKAMQNNPLAPLIKVLQNGGNPMPLVEQMSKNNPIINQGFNMVKGKNQNQLEDMARNLAKERGVDISQVVQGLGFSMPQGK